MITTYPTEWPAFYTATIYKWTPLLNDDKYKNIIAESLRFLVSNKRIELNAFVIMHNHIHLIWQALPGHTSSAVQLSFMKFTAQQIKFDLMKNDTFTLEKFKVNSGDRNYQFWKREALSIQLYSPKVFEQKINYIHNNPVNAGLCKYPEEYYFSSAKFYHDGSCSFDMLTHYLG